MLIAYPLHHSVEYNSATCPILQDHLSSSPASLPPRPPQQKMLNRILVASPIAPEYTLTSPSSCPTNQDHLNLCRRR